MGGYNVKKRGFLIYIFILGLFFIPKSVFAQTYNRTASVGRSAVMNTSNVYYYTDWKLLSTDSLNILPVPYSGGDYYQMGSEYSFPITMNGDTYFTGNVKIPVVSNTIYNYTLMNGLNQYDMKFGIHQNWGVYNVNAIINSSTWECQTYPHLGVAHNYCYYNINFSFSLTEALSGAYNLNVAVLDTSGNRSTYYYSGYDSNGCAIEFPVAASNSGYSSISPYLSMSSTGGSSGSDNTEEILGGIEEATDAITDQIQESYENLVKSQEVCQFIDKSNIVDNGYSLNSSGNLQSGFDSYGVTDYFSILSKSISVIKPLSVSNSSTRSCFYDTNKTFISCVTNAQLSTGSLTIPNNAVYVRFTIQKYLNEPQFQICQNGNQALYDGIMDHDVSGIDFTFGDIDVISDTPVSDLLLLPLELITKITTSLGSGCMTWDLPFNLWGNGNYVLHLPCLDLEDYLGETVWALIDDLFCFLMLFNIFKMLLRFYESWTSLKDTFDNVIGGVR